ncbi:MAG: hypothetical protein OEZ39_08145 [Gammaproteobacteria bacterium]|nr:hypothetical protein [Gammaproteobacteria bacterium]MDH5651832.1 hypothetical protein [Gammaproteobacteria bacterium]
MQYAKLGGINQAGFQISMQRPDPSSRYFKEYSKFQEKLRMKIVALREESRYTQEDMADFELSLRQYQRMEQDPSAIVSLWQVFKIAKAHGLTINDLLDI